MTEQRFQSFDEFWPFYVREHRSKLNRRLHFVGTTAGLAATAAGLLRRKPWLLAMGPVLGYGAAWIGHFFVENNKPASFRYPLWSFRADFKMWSKMLIGAMDDEVERAIASDEAAASNDTTADATASEQGRGANGQSTRIRL